MHVKHEPTNVPAHKTMYHVTCPWAFVSGDYGNPGAFLVWYWSGCQRMLSVTTIVVLRR